MLLTQNGMILDFKVEYSATNNNLYFKLSFYFSSLEQKKKPCILQIRTIQQFNIVYILIKYIVTDEKPNKHNITQPSTFH